MRASPPPHPTNTTAGSLVLLGTHPLRFPLPPSLQPPFSLLLPPRAPCRSPPSRASPPETRYRSADEFEVLRILRGVLLTTRSSAIHPLAFSPFVLVHSDLAPVSLGSFGLPFFPTVFTPPLSPFTIKNRYWISACFHRPSPFSTRLMLVVRFCSLMWGAFCRYEYADPTAEIGFFRRYRYTSHMHYRVFALKEYNYIANLIYSVVIQELL